MTYNNENGANAARVCRNCGATVKDGFLFCIQCGTKYEAGNVCPACKYENKDGMAYCIKCGIRLAGQPAPAPMQAPVYTPPTPAPTQAPAYAPSPKIVCPSCGYGNNEGMQFCIKCGTRLAGQPAPAPAYAPPVSAYSPPAPAYVPPAPAYAPAVSQLRRITIRRESQFVCAANSYKVIVNGSPLGNIPVGRTIVAPVDTEVADVEIICTTIMINKKLRMKLRLGANPVISFTVQWPGDIFESVQDAQILEKSN